MPEIDPIHDAFIDDIIKANTLNVIPGKTQGSRLRELIKRLRDRFEQELIKRALTTDINDRFKGKYTSLVNLQSAYPTAEAGDYAQVDEGAEYDVVNYNYDIENGWIEGGSGSAATSTDELIEGVINLYFTNSRAVSAVQAASLAFSNTTDSTSTNNGSITLQGGLGVAKNITTKSVKITDFVGTDTRVIVSNPDGTTNALYPVVTPIITSSTIITQLNTAGNWSAANVYTGSAIANASQMQYYVDANYFYYMYDDVTPIRIVRNLVALESTNAESLAGTLTNKFLSPAQWTYLKTQVANITNRWQFLGLGVGTGTLTDVWAVLAAATASVGQMRLVQGAVDYTGTVLGTLWNNSGEVKFIDNGGIVNRFQKVYNNALLKGIGTRMLVSNSIGDISATDMVTEQFIVDTDIITAITGATYTNNRATITPANSKIFYQGQIYDDGVTYTYLAVDDNKIRRW